MKGQETQTSGCNKARASCSSEVDNQWLRFTAHQQGPNSALGGLRWNQVRTVATQHGKENNQVGQNVMSIM